MASCASISPRHSDEKIHRSLLELTPLGSTPEAVLAVVAGNGWRTEGYHPKSGFLKQEEKNKSVIGVSSIRASLGNYCEAPCAPTNVSAFWGFDKDRRLIEIWIWRTVDAP